MMPLPDRKEQHWERRAASRLCVKAVLLAAGLFAAGIVLLSLHSSIPSNSAIASIVFLVDAGANGLLLFALLALGLIALGHASLSAGWSLEELWRLLLIHLLSTSRVPPTHIRRPAPEIAWFLLAVKFRAARFAQRLTEERACLRPPSKAPFRLFQQAPLLVSP
jgi:hypothetical protein